MSNLFSAYLAGEATSFFGGHFKDPVALERMRKRVRPIAPALATVLENQNARYAKSPARDAHLLALRRGAAAVVTGQQVGLFLGPLFTIYKAATAIRAAKELSRTWDVPVVPVFWLQTEDHDLPEIAGCAVPTHTSTPHDVRVPCSEGRQAIAHQHLPNHVTECLHELEAHLGHLPHARAHLDRLARHYQPSNTWSDAFAHVLAELFADEGLVFLDPRVPDIAALTAPVHERALTHASTLAGVLEDRVHDLSQAGFAAGVHVRPNAPLSFFHPDGPNGPRYRLEPKDDGYAEVGGTRTHSVAELLRALHKEPLSFSTSALLRPITQDTLLPTVAYVGGPGEITYFAQLPPLYAAFDMQMPLIVPRLRVRVLDDKTQKLCTRLGVTPDAAQKPLDALLAQSRHRTAGLTGEALTKELEDAFNQRLAALTPHIIGLGQGLDVAVEKTRGTVQMAVHKLAEKVEKARLHQDDELVTSANKLKSFLYPNDVPQERFYGLPYFAARYGERAFIERVLELATPFDGSAKDLLL